MIIGSMYYIEQIKDSVKAALYFIGREKTN